MFIPPLQYIDTTVDVPVAKQRRKETTGTARGLHDEVQRNPEGQKMRSAYLRTENKKQNVFDSESRSDLSFTGQKDRNDSQRSPRRNEDQLLPEGEPLRILGNTTTEETLRTRYKKGSRVTHSVKLNTPAKTLSADEAYARVNRRTALRCACATVDFGGDRTVMNLAPHEHAQQSSFLRRSSSTRLLTIAGRCRDKFHSPSGEEMKQSIYLRIQFSDKMEDISCTTENRCRKSSSRKFRRISRFRNYSLHRKRCDPRLRTRRWKRPSKSEILPIRLFSGLSAEQPEPGTSSTRFGRDDPPRSSRQWRCRRKPNTANMKRSCRVKRPAERNQSGTRKATRSRQC